MSLRLFGLCILVFTLSSCHVGRFFIWNFADIHDNRKFPANKILPQGTPYAFTPGKPDAVRLPKAIRYKGKEQDFEQFLIKTKTVGFMVIRNDSVLYERYLDGYSETSEVPSFSMSKSVVSALMGIAIQQGAVRSVNDSITRYLPELDARKFGRIRIEDLLNMRSGIRYNESYINPFGDVAKYYYGTNLKKYVRKLRVKEAPNQRFEYVSVNTLLLCMIIERTTGMPISQYLEEKLWQPMGMEYPATWSVDSRRHRQVKAFCCLNARMRDFARLGSLYLKKGQWNGQQLIPASWIEQSTAPLAANNFNYSYQWWHNIEVLPDTGNVRQQHSVWKEVPLTVKGGPAKNGILVPVNDYYAHGVLGQHIYVYPEKNIVMVRLGKKEAYPAWDRLFLAIARQN